MRLSIIFLFSETLVKMTDSSFECEIERVSSEKDQAFDAVPGNKVFRFKFKDKDGKTYKFFPYELKEGKVLPYTTVLKGVVFCVGLFTITLFFCREKCNVQQTFEAKLW